MEVADQKKRTRKRAPVADDVFMNATGGGLPAAIAATIQQITAAGAPPVSTTLALSDSALSAALVAWITQGQPALVNSNPPLPYATMLAYFQNVNNMPAVRAAMTAYGTQLIPVATIGGKPAYGAGTWENYYKLYIQAYYLGQFSPTGETTANCTQINTLSGLVATELTNIKSAQLAGSLSAQMYSIRDSVLNDIQTNLESMFGQLDCVSAVQQQQTGQNLSLLSSAASDVASSSTSSGGTAITYGLYAVAGLMVVGALVLIFHHSKKPAA